MKLDEMTLDIGVDPHSLDDGWVEQPRLYFRYAAKLADARQELDRAKVGLDLTDAELDLAVRQVPEDFGLTKVTESALRSVILAADPHRKSSDAVLEAKHAVDVLGAAVEALNHKRKALENLVQLHLANYYSSPKAPEGAKDRMREVGKRKVRRRGRDDSSDEG